MHVSDGLQSSPTSPGHTECLNPVISSSQTSLLPSGTALVVEESHGVERDAKSLCSCTVSEGDGAAKGNVELSR